MIFAGACAPQAPILLPLRFPRIAMAWPSIRSSSSGFFPTAKRSNGRRKSHIISDILSGKRAIETLEAACSLQKSRLGAFSVTPDVIIDNTASQELTVIKVTLLTAQAFCSI